MGSFLVGERLAPRPRRRTDLVHRVGRHLPVGRELAARDRDHARPRHRDHVTPGQIGGPLGCRRLDQWPQAGPRAGDVGGCQLRGGGPVDGRQQIGDVLGGALGIVERAVVVGVGGAHVGLPLPWHHEDRAVVAGDRDHGGDVAGQPVRRNGDMDALGRSDRIGVHALVEGADIVGPDPGGVDDHGGSHHRPVGQLGPADPTALFPEGGDPEVVDGDGAVVEHGGAHDLEGQAGVVGAGVVVDEGGHQPVGAQRREVDGAPRPG